MFHNIIQKIVNILILIMIDIDTRFQYDVCTQGKYTENGESNLIRPRKSSLKYGNIFQRWSRGNDEECKQSQNFIPCR